MREIKGYVKELSAASKALWSDGFIYSHKEDSAVHIKILELAVELAKSEAAPRRFEIRSMEEREHERGEI